MTTINKLILIGTRKNVGNVFCTIKLHDGKLSITGVEGPLANGDCRGSCGQIDVAGEWKTFAEGWTSDMVAKLEQVWKDWHLNDMVAGSPAQEAFLKANPVTDRLNYFTTACANLEAAGLQPDPNYLHNGKPYRYGSAWLRKELPQDVVDFLVSLPASSIGMPTSWSR